MVGARERIKSYLQLFYCDNFQYRELNSRHLNLVAFMRKFIDCMANTCNMSMRVLSPFHFPLGELREVQVRSRLPHLTKGGNEKSSDESIEDALEKDVKLLTYITGKDSFAEIYRHGKWTNEMFDK
ncbi:uncharacterized protein LOC131033617 isoform X1 [Cryptomeria japonica]|uniref:uncharacterized protein LOC131033617 isoform X1 n=1 Tax=Cryptomeria japonica TaxID=3369 RepID=UPI0027DA5F15|nr:uncharacterized protein LOC131033617 isoform X1 [Cryptomeria japonica]